ncbi:MAG: FAD-binding oxidoreductase [Chloroflexota bacterium]|nr:FAD-binding oxidoreductase [Chloroflexota bacterium]
MPRQFLSNPSGDDLPRSADAIIIGGGPTGTAILWALARAQPDFRAVLIERAPQLAAGSSTASLENFRTCWPAPSQMKLMTRSIHIFEQHAEFFGERGAAINARRHGYLYCGITDADAARLQAEVAHLHDIGLAHIEYLDTDEVQARHGWLGDRLIAGKYDPIAGWLDSHALVYAFAQSAPNAHILLDVPDTQIVVEGGRVLGVRTPNGFIASPHVVIAAGAWSRQVGRTAGVELPIIMRPRQSFTTGWRHPEFPADSPMIIGASPYQHVRPEAGTGAIFGWEYEWNTRKTLPDQPVSDHLIDPVDPVSQFKDPRFPSLALAVFARQFGHADSIGFAHPGYQRKPDHHVGYYVSRDATCAYTTDAHGARHPYDSQRAIMDVVPGVEGLFMSVAHVGHGIMSAPATGEIMASLLLDQPLPDPDYAAFKLNVPSVEYDIGGLGASETTTSAVSIGDAS